MRRVVSRVGNVLSCSGRVVISITTNVAFSLLGACLAGGAKFSSYLAAPAVFHVVPGATVRILDDVAFMTTHGTSGRRASLVVGVFGRLKGTVLIRRHLVSTKATLTSDKVTFTLHCVHTTVRNNIRLNFCPGRTRRVIIRAIGKTISLLLRGGDGPRARVSGMAAPKNVAVGKLGRVRLSNFASSIVQKLGTDG